MDIKHTFHCHLRRSLKWYHNWHDHPRHQHTHWALFLVVSFWIFSLLSGQVRNFYFESAEYRAHAQGNLTLSLSGDRFSINGTPKFLLFVSYFDAMQASDATLDSDLGRLQSLGFNGIRVLVNWNPPNNPGQLMDSGGNLRPGMLNRLINIIQKAQARNMVVDVTFVRDTVTGLNFTNYKNGIIATAQGLISLRSLFFDIQNEADHDGVTCGTARICPAEARQIRDAVKAVDPQRIVGISVDSSNNQAYVISGGMDIALSHRSLGPLTGTSGFVAQQKSAAPGLPVHLQEPGRCRTNPCDWPVNDYLNSARDAKCSGAAGWTFHTSGGYSLSGNTMFNQWLDPNIENAVANGLTSALIGACSPNTPGVNAPVITSISPSSATEGTPVTITGTDLDQCEPVTLGGGTPSTICNVQFMDVLGNRTTVSGTKVSPTTVTGVVGAGLCSGLGTVRVGDLVNFSNDLPFTIVNGTGTFCDNAPTNEDGPPVIVDFYPKKATKGSEITVIGNFLAGKIDLLSLSGDVFETQSWFSEDGHIAGTVVPMYMEEGLYRISVTNSAGSTVASDMLEIRLDSPVQPQSTDIFIPQSVGFGDLVSNIFTYSIGLVGLAVFIMILYGGFLWLTSAANPSNIAVAKKYIYNALLGALLLIASYVILYTINPEFVGGDIELPEITNPNP